MIVNYGDEGFASCAADGLTILWKVSKSSLLQRNMVYVVYRAGKNILRALGGIGRLVAEL